MWQKIPDPVMYVERKGFVKQLTTEVASAEREWNL